MQDGDEILRSLSAAPLRQLTGEQLGPYITWALTTVGNGEDYRYFLPRFFELYVANPPWLGMEPPIMADKLNMSDWRGWRVDERDAVLNFFRAAFAYVLGRHPFELRQADLWFCALITLGESAPLTFQLWRSNSRANAALNLAAFVNDEAKNIARHGHIKGPFWGDVPVSIREDVAKRLSDNDNKEVLRSASIGATEEDTFYFIEAALANLATQY